MRRTRVLGGLVFGSILGVAVAVYAAETKAPSETFEKYCAKCHGLDGRAKTNKGKQLKAQDFTDPEFQAETSDADLIKAVTEGKDDMPPFGKKLTPEEIQSLVKNDVRGFAPKK
ncbi:MAG TPA: cytochrome c [Thermoanaerobaculia bacterium]|nr:cytochrome c [Thermoanaerobaculia bacterium]